MAKLKSKPARKVNRKANNIDGIVADVLALVAGDAPFNRLTVAERGQQLQEMLRAVEAMPSAPSPAEAEPA